MPTRYAHTNIISEDWERLADFYQTVFDCRPVPPPRDQSGEWLEKGTGVRHARLHGMHLRLPGWGDNGPTLEIFSYDDMLERPGPPAANRRGLGHLAFQVDDVRDTLGRLVMHGGTVLGEIVDKDVKGVGRLTFAYATDPEGNIVEVQKWLRA
jgi:predicted enzyme related to lactoylglutathione lyase